MRTVKLLISAFIFVSCLIGCEDDSRNEKELPQDNRDELLLSAEIGTADLTGVETKADPIIEAFEDKKFDLIVRDHKTEDILTTSLASTVDSVPIGNKVSVGLTPRLYWDDLGGTKADLDLIGIYPREVYSAGATMLEWSVKEDQSTVANHNEGSDLMLAYVDSYKYQKGTTANLLFNHVLTKITLNLGGDLLSDIQLAEAEVKINNVVTSGKVSLVPTSGTYTYDNSAAPGNVTPYKTKISDKAYSYAAIVYPFTKAVTTEDEKVTIATITVKTEKGDNNIYYVKLPTKEKEFKAGENNVYNVSINKTEVSVTASVVNWTDVVEDDVIPSKLSFEPGNISITGTTITDGSVLYVSITDEDTDPAKHTTTYVYDGTKWDLKSGVEAIYWDDLAQPYTNNKVRALLILDGEGKDETEKEANRTNGDKIFTSTTSLKTTIETPFDMGDLSHPMAKFTITIQTPSKDATDRIELSEIQSVIFATGWNTFEINGTNTGITETTTPLTATVGGEIKENVKQDDNTFRDEVEYIGYIAPPESSQGTLNNICTVVMVNGNRYAVNLGKDKITEFTAGNHYKYKVNITKTEVSFTSQLVDWVDDNGGNINTGL